MNNQKEFLRILPYFGSTHYRYEVLPMGLAISPAAWLMYVNMLLETFRSSKKSFIAIMDDLLIHSTQADHFKLIETLLKGLCLHGLKLSPKKSQLFRTELTYMGNIFTIQGALMTIRPLRTRLQAIQQYPRPHTVHDCKSFCGVVNYLSLFCKDLQKLLHPIYHLTHNGIPFHWTITQEKNFNIIKRRLCESPVLTLPTADGRFILYSDTSRKHTGSALWQIQDGFPRLIGYASKTLPPAVANYSVTELEMTGLLMNIHAWHGWTQGAEVDVAVDHKAVVQILKSKELPATGHIGLLIRKLGPLPFNLYYVKGKDLILTDFLSWIKSDDSDPSKVLPISFVDMQMTNPPPEYKLQIRTRSSAKCEGATVPPVHGIEKALDPHKKPEHQSPQPNARPPPTPAGPYPTPPLIQKPSPAMTASKKLIGRSIKTLNKHKQSTKTMTSHPAKFQIPPPDAPLTPSFTPSIQILLCLPFNPRKANHTHISSLRGPESSLIT